MANNLPEFVLDGTFEDHEWRSAASKKSTQRSRTEQVAAEKGPREHPYPPSKAFKLEAGEHGPAKWFPNEQAANAWASSHSGTARAAPSQQSNTSPPPKAPAGYSAPKQAEITDPQTQEYAQEAERGEKPPLK